jgi:small subunit ribosomal protein S2
MSKTTEDPSTTLGVNKDLIDSLFSVGAHFGYAKARRHPSAAKYIFGAKNGIEIFDLEKTSPLLEEALTFIESIAQQGKQVLFVSGKREAIRPVREWAEKIDQPYVAGRWIGGILTNFEQIQQRVNRLEKLLEEKEKGLLAKYTKKERLLIDREIEKLEARFGGIVSMKKMPGAIFIIDTDAEDIAVNEARHKNIPVVSLSNSDCNLGKTAYPIPGNDNSVQSINLVLSKAAEAYTKGVQAKKSAADSAQKADTKK